jgi:hypothetical protein
MISPPRPDDETERLAAVAATGLVGTAPEPAFSNITRLAALPIRDVVAWILNACEVLASAVLSACPPDLAALRPEVSPGLVRVVRRCLSKSRDERYATAWDLARDLALHRL